MDREQIEKFAREASQWAMRNSGEPWAYEREFARLVHNASLDKAKAALPQPPGEADIEAEGDYALGQCRGIHDCTVAIESLKEPQP